MGLDWSTVAGDGGVPQTSEEALQEWGGRDAFLSPEAPADLEAPFTPGAAPGAMLSAPVPGAPLPVLTPAPTQPAPTLPRLTKPARTPAPPSPPAVAAPPAAAEPALPAWASSAPTFAPAHGTPSGSDVDPELLDVPAGPMRTPSGPLTPTTASPPLSPAPPRAARPKVRGWAGTGGGKMIAARFAVIAALGITSAVGAKTLVLGSGATSVAPDTFPRQAVGAYAAQYLAAYFTFTPGNAAQRSAALAPYLPKGSLLGGVNDDQEGWDGSGQPTSVTGVQILAVTPRDASTARVDALVQIAPGGTLGVSLGVAVSNPPANSQPGTVGGISVTSLPSLTAIPGRAPLPAAPEAVTDADTSVSDPIKAIVSPFLSAWAGTDPVALSRFLTPGVTLAPLAGGLTVNTVTDVIVPAETTDPTGFADREITVAVRWTLPSGVTIPAAYRLTITHRTGAWSISAARPVVEDDKLLASNNN